MSESEKTEISLAAVERIMRNAGAENLTTEAIELLRESTQELGDELAEDAIRIAREQGRDTISADDIIDAIEA